jgi:Glycosyltransferases involved in cell wall biogenesis
MDIFDIEVVCMGNILLSVVVPMYFEEEVAMKCYERLTGVMKGIGYSYELIFVNDGSTDKTLQILREIASNDKEVKVISFSRNFGHQAAVSAGLKKVKGDAVIIIDADLQDPPELIPDMVKLWQGGYDVVYAKRKKRKGETWFKLITAKYFYKFLAGMTETQIPQDTGDFRLIDKKVADVFNALSEKNRFIRGIISWIGFKQVPIEYERDERAGGATKYTLKKMLKLASDGIISFSSKPVKIIEKLGVFLSFVGFVLFIISAFNSFKTGITVCSALLFLSGIQLLATGIMGEYIFRIFDEVRNRPLYITEEEINTQEEE